MANNNGSSQVQTLLVVEDEILLAVALKEELEAAGYRVLKLANCHKEALEAARTGHADLALVNINLRGSRDGIALAADLGRLGIPSLFISGQVSRARSAQSAAIGSMPKPYSAIDMVAAVTYLFGHMKGDESFPKPPGLEVFGA